jgi:hypothetical protein
MQFEYRDGQELSLSVGGRRLWRYAFGTDREKPYIHPLRTPSGVELTAFEPWDHQWHRGLWFSWQYINDVNYWEERQGIPPGVGKGAIHFRGPEVVSLSPRGAEVRTHYEYIDPQGVDVLESVRTLHFHIPKKDRYLIDWELSWNAKTDLVIRRTPEDWGGYSGLSLRMARTLGQFQLLNSNGQTGEATQHAPARWVDISGRSDGGWDLAGGVAILEHPENLRAPNPWKTFGQDGFGFINPTLVMKEPIHLDTGAGFTLNYRVVVHDGVLPAEELNDLHAEYVAG